MNTQDQQDAHFLSMVSLIAARHNAEFDVDMENRTVNFLTANVTQQLIDDMMTLFGDNEYPGPCDSH